MLSPTALLASYWILALEEDSVHRPSLCSILINVRAVTTIVLANNLIFSFLFRCLVILHAEKGLVGKGKLNLRLLNQLYWTIVIAFNVLSVFILLYANLTVNWPAKFRSASRMALCLMVGGKDINQQAFGGQRIGLAFTVIFIVTLLRCKLRVTRFLKGLCPRGRMNCIGIYRRNVVSLKGTVLLSCLIITSTILENVFLQSRGDLSTVISKKSIFLIWNISYIILSEGVYLILPMVISKPNMDTGRTNIDNTFYVRAPAVLVPRSPYNGILLEMSSYENKTSSGRHFSYISQRFNKGPRANLLLQPSCSAMPTIDIY